MIPHLLRYQGLAVDDYGFILDALDLGHPKLSLNKGYCEIRTASPHFSCMQVDAVILFWLSTKAPVNDVRQTS